MDKNAIKKYAVWARRELISRVTQKALQYGITDNEIVPADASNVNGVVLTAQQKKERQALIAKINAEGFEQVMEEVAYTWFNRFSALRFMEVNGYLPTHVRVFTDEDNRYKPQILAEAINLEIDGLNMDKVYALKDANDTDTLFKYLIITQCNALSSILPGMFQKIDDYTELLFPDNLLREGSAIEQMIALIPENDWKDAVQIIGWLYQYYNVEKKDDVFAALKKNVKITKENIPAATQLFTPDWIVRYMVENSLGRLWVEGHHNEELKENWKYYLEEAEQESDVQVKLAELRKEYATLKPEDIKCIDPCCGSGHILAYLFDVLAQIYEAYGYTAREAVASIVENNIYGLDIDDRAAQLASFAVMMKARQYDRRFFGRGIQPHVYAIVESNHVDAYTVEYFANGDVKLTKAIKTIIEELHDAKEYGSILTVTQQDWTVLYNRFDEIREDVNISSETAINDLLPLVQVAQVLAQKYDVVVTNPPYMGGKSMSSLLSKYVQENYTTTKFDLFSVFIEHGLYMTKKHGFNCMVTMQSWMFLSSFEKMRFNILENYCMDNLLHMDNMVMGIAFGTAVSVIRKCRIKGYVARFSYIEMADIDKDTPKTFPSYSKRNCVAKVDDFQLIPAMPIAYWASKKMIENFVEYPSVGELFDLKQGMITADNERFLRHWREVDITKFVSGSTSIDDFVTASGKWLPYVKGGEYRKWYGNNELVVNWENEGFEIRNFKNAAGKLLSRPQNIQYFTKEGASWSIITNGNFSLRYTPTGFGFDARGSMMFAKGTSNIYYALALMCSNVARIYLEFLSPTVSFEVGNVGKVPYLFDKEHSQEIIELAKQNVKIAKEEWDSYESSWDFKKHPLLPIELGAKIKIEELYAQWQDMAERRYDELKRNEESLNKLLASIYGLESEIRVEVSDKDISLRKADLKKNIISLISYAVGCMFGRYSLDEEGIAYAGGVWNPEKYHTYPVDKDNIIPISDDEYFTDDIVSRLIDFVRVVYGIENLECNLQFIADALGGKGTSREVIRTYFQTDFYIDHCTIYSVVNMGKCPVYWLFDSGKKNGFKALVYMHRYQPDTIARIRTDYVHEQQGRYRTAIAELEQRIDSASTGERVKLTKQLKSLQDQSAEIHEYEEKIHHLADQYISIDLDDGVKVNYAKFQDVLAKIK